MPLLTLTGGCLAYGHLPLLDRAELRLDAHERVALIGRNGSGKSSLLAVLAGAAPLDDGTIWRAPGLRIGYLPQEPVLDASATVFEAVVAGMGETTALLADYHDAAHRLAESPVPDDALLGRLHELQEALEIRGAWTWASHAERAVERFGLDAEARVGELSGGQMKRVALARALVVTPDLLLLDEPTNHLDIDSIAWLEEFLIDCGATLVVVTHDRRFLDRLATRVIELDRGALASFEGGFAEYQRRKERMLADEALRDGRSDKLLQEEEAWIRKGVEARRTRAAFRVQRLERLREQRALRRERLGRAKLSLDAGDLGGELVAELDGVTKRFGERAIVRDFSCRILRGDRVGVIGPNGAGKTTLLRLILGEIEPDAGRVRRGARLAIAYYDQFRAVLDSDATLAEVISPGSEYVEIGGIRTHVVGYLGEFLFAPQRARSPVRTLSGGERNRLLLARLFARPANVVVLDEPTNDLDIETLELLEQLLQDYAGTLIVVSHDRAFLDNVVTQVIAPVGEGVWLENAGGYADWISYRERLERERSAQPRVAGATGKSSRGAQDGSRAPARKPSRLTFNETRELARLPDRIAELEGEQKSLTALLEDPALHARDPAEGRRIASRLGQIEAELAELMERWEALESRASV